MRSTPWSPRIGLSLATCALMLQATEASPLDDQISAFEASSKPAESEVVEILRLGLKENRSARTFAATKTWLNANPSGSPALLHQAAQVAERAGDLGSAAGYYRKLLKNPGLSDPIARSAVPATYRLLINPLGSPETAYLLMREDGNRLRAFGNASRFDAWFISQAQQRQDLPALIQRLAAIGNDPRSELSPYRDDLEWLCRQLESFKPETEAWHAAALDLAKCSRLDEAYQARITWAAEVVAYNLKLDRARNTKRAVDPTWIRSPLQAAQRLLLALPNRGAFLVADGWGVEYDQAHLRHAQQRFVTQGDLKLNQLLRHLPSMAEDQRDDLLAYPMANRNVKFDPATVRKWLIQEPGLLKSLNTLSAANVSLVDASMTPEEAKAMAPQLARYPHPDGAIIRLFASGERDYANIIDRLVQSEAWRYDDIKTAAKAFWKNPLFKSEGERDAPLAKYKKFTPDFQKLQAQVSAKASSKDRQSALKTLQQDLTSPSPKIPGALSLWDALFAQSPDADTTAMLRGLTSNLTGDRDYLLRRALDKASFGKSGRMPWRAVIHGNHYQYHQQNTRKVAAELIEHLGQLLLAQAKSGALSETIFGMWFHSAVPSDPQAQAVMRSLAKSPAFSTLSREYQSVAADDKHFKALALAPSANSPDPEFISRELLALPENPSAKQVEAALSSAINNASHAPTPVAVLGLEPVAKLKPWSAAVRSQVLSLFSENAPIGAYPTRQGYQELVERVANDFAASDRIASIEPHAAALWHAAAATHDLNRHQAVTALSHCITAAITKGQYSIAMTLARSGQKSAVSKRMTSSGQERLNQVWAQIGQQLGEAAIEIGAIEIPVSENDPSYPIYQSNAEFIQGNFDSAWTLYHKHADELPNLLRSLSAEYGLWLLDENIAADETQRAENLVKELTIWSRQAEGTFNLEQEAQLRISYADLAFRKGALPTARAWYRKIADAAEYQGTEMHLRSALGSVNVDRASKNFSSALDELDKLMRLSNPEFRLKVRYARAEVLMDQENFADALQELEAVLRSQPKHPDALILRGKIHYQMRKLVEASEIELGPSQTDTVIVPGEALKINLRDPSLHVSGLGADIEVEIRAASGDVERLLLHQLGDSKEKFRAEIATALGSPRKGDKILQILGKDEIRFGYSARFRARMDDLPADPDTVISVASDAYLALTAGAFPPREGERKLNIEELGLSTAQAALGTRSVRPGNPIYLRLTDSDRSITPGIDTITVDLMATSGDEIRKLILTETQPYSGEFEAIVPTTSAQAIAFASDSSPGRDPNMAISSADYPGWQGEVGNKGNATTFGVDLNDNVAVDSMEVTTGPDSQSLTHFVLQTSMNGLDWEARARFPNDTAPWDGRPQLTSFPTFGGRHIPVSIPVDYSLPQDWLDAMELGSCSGSVNYLSAYVEGLSQKDLPVAHPGHSVHPVVIRYRAMFYQPAAAIRTFQVHGLPAANDKGEIRTLLLLDGKPATEDSQTPLTIQRELGPGLHTIEVWTHDGRDAFLKRKPALLCDEVGQEQLVPCSPNMFNKYSFPEGIRNQLPQPASVLSIGNQVRVKFGDQTQARMVRLSIHGFEGVAPTIQKVTLNNRDGQTLLPVEQDYKELRENQQLEVLPGDQIIARYEDPVSATPKRNRQQKTLGVAFNSGTISASFLDYELNKEGERVLVLEPIRRFRLDDAIAIVVDDADLDSSSQRDTIDLTLTSSSGNTTTLKALETEEHSGRFIGRVFPVEGDPSRSSEIQITPGGTLTATYRDAENLDPGIPTMRTVTISHALYAAPAIETYAISTDLLPRAQATAQDDSKKPTKSRGIGPELVVPHRSLQYAHIAADNVDDSTRVGLIGADLRFDIIASHLALASSSEINAYVQTDAARMAAKESTGPYDLTVPGTLKLKGSLHATAATAPDGYELTQSPKPPTQSPPLEEGRFSFSLPLILGDPPARSFATKSAAELPSSAIPDGLAVKAGDIIHVGFPWQDPDKKVHWKQLSFVVGGNAMLDVMQNGYQEPLSTAYVGEKVHLRLLAPNLDQTPNRDTTTVSLKGSSGASTDYTLQETESHSGVFKAVFNVSYAAKEIPSDLPPVALNGFPVRYGDTITISYQDQTHDVTVKKGADGLIKPFSKRFTGDEMAVRTSFTLSECYFELAKKHREMQQESLARREIGHARKLLAEALANHRDESLKAHAEYLLGNLAQEFADLAKNDEAKLPMYQDALARFSKIPTDYPDSEFAPKAQFKTALVYEKMREIENSVEEYVKLAYKYPNHELIPTVMARLGGYFQKKGQQFKEQADPLRDKSDDASIAEILRLDQLSYPEFLNAAMVFAKLQQRFPDDPLAGIAGLRAAQNLMRAHQYERAIKQFKVVTNNENYDDSDVRAQGIYWAGLCYERLPNQPDLKEAYELYRRVTFDFPDSKWAKYARGRLADPVFSPIITREQLDRERMIDALKESQKK